MTTPSMAPEKLSPCIPWMPVTAAERMSLKSPGSAWMSSQIMPISVIRTGSHLGHMKLSPDAPPIVRKTPKPGLVMKVPSPRKAKLRPSPPSSNDPTLTSAPMAPKLMSSSSSAASVLM